MKVGASSAKAHTIQNRGEWGSLTRGDAKVGQPPKPRIAVNYGVVSNTTPFP